MNENCRNCTCNGGSETEAEAIATVTNVFISVMFKSCNNATMHSDPAYGDLQKFVVL